MNKIEIVANNQLQGRFSIKALQRTIRSLHQIPSLQINSLPVRDTEFLSWKMIPGSWDDGLLLVCLLHKIFETLPSPPLHYLYQSFFSFSSSPFRNLFPFSCPGITNLEKLSPIKLFLILLIYLILWKVGGSIRTVYREPLPFLPRQLVILQEKLQIENQCQRCNRQK